MNDTTPRVGEQRPGDRDERVCTAVHRGAAAAAVSDELTPAMFGFWAHRLALSAQIVERAIERGEADEVVIAGATPRSDEH